MTFDLPLFYILSISIVVIGALVFVYQNSDLPEYFNRPKKIEPIEPRHRKEFDLPNVDKID